MVAFDREERAGKNFQPFLNDRTKFFGYYLEVR
jgi:hypothetical protein